MSHYEDLPEELQLNIIGRLPARDVARSSQVSRTFSRIGESAATQKLKNKLGVETVSATTLLKTLSNIYALVYVDLDAIITERENNQVKILGLFTSREEALDNAFIVSFGKRWTKYILDLNYAAYWSRDDELMRKITRETGFQLTNKEYEENIIPLIRNSREGNYTLPNWMNDFKRIVDNPVGYELVKSYRSLWEKTLKLDEWAADDFDSLTLNLFPHSGDETLYIIKSSLL